MTLILVSALLIGGSVKIGGFLCTEIRTDGSYGITLSNSGHKVFFDAALSSFPVASPDGNRLYLSSWGSLYCFDRNCKLAWQIPNFDYVSNPAALTAGGTTILCFEGSTQLRPAWFATRRDYERARLKECFVDAYSLDGKLVWKKPLDEVGWPIAPVGADEFLTLLGDCLKYPKQESVQIAIINSRGKIQRAWKLKNTPLGKRTDIEDVCALLSNDSCIQKVPVTSNGGASYNLVEVRDFKMLCIGHRGPIIRANLKVSGKNLTLTVQGPKTICLKGEFQPHGPHTKSR